MFIFSTWYVFLMFIFSTWYVFLVFQLVVTVHLEIVGLTEKWEEPGMNSSIVASGGIIWSPVLQLPRLQESSDTRRKRSRTSWMNRWLWNAWQTQNQKPCKCLRFNFLLSLGFDSHFSSYMHIISTGSEADQLDLTLGSYVLITIHTT